MPKQTFFNLPPAKQRNIVYAALTEFTNKGYLLGSVGTIAKNATVSKGSMYQYFEDKKEFYIYLTDYVYSMIKTTMKMQLQSHIQIDASLGVVAEQIKEIIIQPILKQLMQKGSIRNDMEVEYLVLYCQSVIGICKTQLLSAVNYLEEENKLAIRMKKEEWNVIFDTVIKLATTGLSPE